jgi:hypothetical protein
MNWFGVRGSAPGSSGGIFPLFRGSSPGEAGCPTHSTGLRVAGGARGGTENSSPDAAIIVRPRAERAQARETFVTKTSMLSHGYFAV